MLSRIANTYAISYTKCGVIFTFSCCWQSFDFMVSTLLTLLLFPDKEHFGSWGCWSTWYLAQLQAWYKKMLPQPTPNHARLPRFFCLKKMITLGMEILDDYNLSWKNGKRLHRKVNGKFGFDFPYCSWMFVLFLIFNLRTMLEIQRNAGVLLA